MFASLEAEIFPLGTWEGDTMHEQLSLFFLFSF